MVGSHFNELIVLDKVDGLFKGESTWRSENNVLVAAGSSDVGELLAADQVDYEIVVAGIFTDDHPFVYLVAGIDEKGTPLLDAKTGIGSDLAGAIGDEDAIGSAGDIAFVGTVAIKDGRQDPQTTGGGEKIVSVAHETARGNQEFNAGDIVFVRT